MEIEPCQVMIDGKQCGKLDTKRFGLHLDECTHRKSYHEKRCWVGVNVCADCAGRMQLSKEFEVGAKP